MAATALKQITAKAKSLQRANKKLQWKDAIKKASADYRSKHKPAAKKAVRKKAVRKKAVGKKPVRKKRAVKRHTDTRSHNVNIRVVSGAKVGNVTPGDFTRISNDVNGNPRYVISWLGIAKTYPAAVKIANKVGGKKFHNKQYGGGIVFQSYSLPETAAALNRAIAASNKVGSTLLLEKGESPRKKPTRVLQVRRTKAGTYKKFSRLGSLPAYQSPNDVKEILLTADNDFKLYQSKREPILKNLYRKWKKGIFSTDKAAKLWLYYVNDADKLYNKTYVNKNAPGYLLSISDRRLAALELAKETLQDFESGSLSFSMTT